MNSARNCTKLYDKIAGNAGSPAKRQGLARLSHKPSQRFRVTCSAGEGPSSSSLSVLVRRKHTEVAETLEELGIEAVEERMQSAVASPSQPPFRVAQAISAPRLQGMPAVIVELARAPGQNTEGLLETARMLEKSGAEAIVLRTDGDDTPSGLLDLFEVCRSVRVPVLRKELVLHPIQVVESKEAGAAGVVGVITSVTGNGTPTLARFAAAIGLDAPVEIVNRQEMDFVEKFNAPLYGINVTVGLNAQIPGLADTVMKGLVQDAPFGAMTVVGAKSRLDAEAAVRVRLQSR